MHSYAQTKPGTLNLDQAPPAVLPVGAVDWGFYPCATAAGQPDRAREGGSAVRVRRAVLAGVGDRADVSGLRPQGALFPWRPIRHRCPISLTCERRRSVQ